MPAALLRRDMEKRESDVTNGLSFSISDALGPSACAGDKIDHAGLRQVRLSDERDKPAKRAAQHLVSPPIAVFKPNGSSKSLGLEDTLQSETSDRATIIENHPDIEFPKICLRTRNR
jgi:hypothetical protein